MFEANAYKPYILGNITAKLFKSIYDELETAKREYPNRVSAVAPYLCPAHWQRYWYGKRQKDERGKMIGEYWEVVLHPIRMVGGIPKEIKSKS